ncbi:hypothetical protein H8E50_08360 [bacterium]|nr:hypothetical protein [bacterium]
MVLPGALFASDKLDIELRGYLKTLVSISDATSYNAAFSAADIDDISDIDGEWANSLRLDLRLYLNNKVEMEAAYELSVSLQDTDNINPLFTDAAAKPLSYRASDIGVNLYARESNRNLTLKQNLDRIFFTVTTGQSDIYIGRQAIAFGSARVINPTDIITSFTYTELNSEERSGVDSIRLRMPLGDLSELDAGVVAGDDLSLKKSAAFIRARFSAGDADISPIVILFRQNMLAGLDIAGSVGDAGYWIEAAWTFAGLADKHISSQDYLRVSIGSDYSFNDRLYAFIEYHFSGAGLSGSESYADVLGRAVEPAFSDGAVYLLGKHYLAPGFTYSITPLWTMSMQSLVNLDDPSLLFAPGVQYSLSDNAVIECGAYLGAGGSPLITPDFASGSINVNAPSEFGLYQDVWYIAAKLYF